MDKIVTIARFPFCSASSYWFRVSCRLDSELRNFLEEEEAVAFYRRKLAFKQLNSTEPGPAQKINRTNECISLANQFYVRPRPKA